MGTQKKINYYIEYPFLYFPDERKIVFWKSIHQEVAAGPFCLLVNSPWPIVFSCSLFLVMLSTITLYCWRATTFSWSNIFLLGFLFLSLIMSLHFWFRDLVREFYKKYEILLMVLFI